MTNIDVEGANGGLHTNYEGKARAAIKALLEDGYDFAYIHVEAPDEMGHQGLIAEKIEAIEKLDRYVVQVLVEEFEKAGVDYRMLVLPDHPTPIRVRTHTSDPVPYLLYDSTKSVEGKDAYHEKAAAETGIVEKDGYLLRDKLLEL